MSHGLVKYLYYLDGDGCFVVPNQTSRVQPELRLVRNTYHTVRLQGLRTQDVTLNEYLSAPTASQPDWPTFTDAIFGLKVQARYDDGGDFASAWSGFDTGDTAWHDPSNRRYSFAIAPTTTLDPAIYLAGINLTLGALTMPLPDSPLKTILSREFITGDEATAPSGIGGIDGTATILDGTDNIAVSFDGMTATGLIIPFWVGSSQSTLSAVAGTNSFTIWSGGPVSGNVVVGYFVVRIS